MGGMAALYKRQRIRFAIPSLYPELEALTAASDEMLSSAQRRMSMMGGLDAGESNGFSLYLDEKVTHFLCSSEVEFLGWIQVLTWFILEVDI